MPFSPPNVSDTTTSLRQHRAAMVTGVLLAVGISVVLLRTYAFSPAETPQVSLAEASIPPVVVQKAPAALPEPDKINLPNFAEVAPGIYRGGAPTSEGWKKLHDFGIRTEIDLRIEKKERAVAETATKKYGMERLHLPMGAEAPTKKQVTTFLATLDNPAKRPVFIHCQHGADRTGAMVGIYRETHDGWDFPKTYSEMRHYGFKPFLKELKGAVQKRAPKKG